MTVLTVSIETLQNNSFTDYHKHSSKMPNYNKRRRKFPNNLNPPSIFILKTGGEQYFLESANDLNRSTFSSVIQRIAPAAILAWLLCEQIIVNKLYIILVDLVGCVTLSTSLSYVKESVSLTEQTKYKLHGDEP